MGSKVNKGLGFLVGIGSGAALMYVFDPISGTRRRSIARGKLQHAEVALSHELDKARRDITHRGRGLVARSFWSLWARAFQRTPVDGDKLIARVRSELGRLVSHPRAIQVSTAAGWIILNGQVLEHEADNLLRRIGKVQGVRGIEDRLERYTTADNVPSLQGSTFRSPPRAAIFQEEWPPSLRLIAGTIGAYYTLKGLRRGGVSGTILKLAGAAVLARSIMNIPTKRILGIGAGHRVIDLQKTITVQAPLDEVYRFWTHIENFPRFMQHVLEVTRIDEKQSHWTVMGPAGKSFQWTAELTTQEENRIFGWRTLPGATIEHQGVIRFQDAGDGATRLDIRMSYNPPAGVIGHGIATFFRVDPKTAMDEDLVRMKTLLESGKSRAHGQTVTVEELEETTPPVIG
jgi:uncharacterized membrane protein